MSWEFMMTGLTGSLPHDAIPAPGHTSPALNTALDWNIPWMEEPGGLQSMGSLRVGHD